MPSTIVTKQDCIDAILSNIDSGADRMIVKRWLDYCDEVKYDSENKGISCAGKLLNAAQPCNIIPRMGVYLSKNGLWGGFRAVTSGISALHPTRMKISDANGIIWMSSGEKWSTEKYKDIYIETVLFGFPNDFTVSDADSAMNAISNDNDCVIKIENEDKYRSADIDSEIANEFKLFYEAYTVLKKYYTQME